MSTSSFASSRLTHHRQFTGVPSRCWCGRNLKTFCSQTVENPLGDSTGVKLQFREKQNSIYSNGLRIQQFFCVDTKVLRLVYDVKELKKEMANIVASQKKLLANVEEEMKKKLNEEMQVKLNEEMILASAYIGDRCAEMTKKSIISVVIIGLVVGII